MDRCDVAIVGGGPAGSSCARVLSRAGLDVLVIDKAAFPREKVCAGWITPQVVEALELDCDDYRTRRTFQPVNAFRVGLIGGGREIQTTYGHPVSFGIRRCEFDHYLLERSGARLKLGAPISAITRVGDEWAINDAIRTPMLVGAAGHFCPVSRLLNPVSDGEAVVVAQEAEFPVETDRELWPMTPGVPELYFCKDLKGYGWCFLKGHHLNIGLGRLDRRSVRAVVADFVDFLRARRKVPARAAWKWSGHAYLVQSVRPRRAADAGVLLAGDAAGLAVPQSGEGIWPAIASGLLAASAILAADGRYTRERLEPYEIRLRRQFGVAGDSRLLAAAGPLATSIGRRLLSVPWFVRHLVLDRWFLRGQTG